MQHSVHDRLKIAKDFLSNFKGHEIYVTNFDPKIVNGYELSEMDKKPWHYHQTFDESAEAFFTQNTVEKGRAIFFTVNELDQTLDSSKKRTNKMWVKSRAIWCEDDNIRNPEDSNDFNVDWPLVPNLVVNTSPGKFHYYWLTDCDDSYQWQIVQQKMVDKYGSDKSAKDMARILRIPGFYHLKDPKHPHFINYYKLMNARYSWNEIVNAFMGKNFTFNEPKNEENTSQVDKKKVERAKKDRIFIRNDPAMDLIIERGLVKNQLQKGEWDITCPWVNEHTNQEDSGTRFFQAHYNGFDQDNFKCNHDHCADRTIKDFLEKIGYNDHIKIPKYIRDDLKIKNKFKPEFPKDFMQNWPEPWPTIWRNWKKIPRELSQSLLTPTVISLHGYLLDSRYVTEWGRRPNLYMLNIAESAANKDTNSKDVLRAIGNILTNMGILNTVFNEDLYSADTNITSDTAFLTMLDRSDGNFYWLNTEATRVFQQLNVSKSNSAVMALSDKIIEVVDGHGITSKSKADGKILGCTDPNIQIVFYAQPETIEKYIDESLVDSGFLGRAIITLDDKDVTINRPSMFIRRNASNKLIDQDLAEFYANMKINSPVKNRIIAEPDEKGLIELEEWERKVIHPILDENEQDGYMYKMISRIGNTAEQLYAIIYGICVEWDKFKGVKPRTQAEISPSCMFEILEFWTKSKEYVVREYVNIGLDPIAQEIEKVLFKLIKGEIKIEKCYEEKAHVNGLVPRSILMRNMRNRRALVRKLNTKMDSFVVKVNHVLDTMISNNILREEMLARPDRLLKAKKTKFIGFY